MSTDPENIPTTNETDASSKLDVNDKMNPLKPDASSKLDVNGKMNPPKPNASSKFDVNAKMYPPKPDASSKFDFNAKMNPPKPDASSKLDVDAKMNPPKPDESKFKTTARKVTKTIVTSPDIYKPVGPYSQAILADKTLYVSGILGMEPTGTLVEGGAEGQTRQALGNLRHVLEAGGASLESVVKCTILLSKMDDFQAVNKIYAEFFPKDFPARATFQVGQLPLNAAVEIEAIALSGDLVIAEAGPCPCAKI